jgi:ubiquinone/menaquinone biosynthesis C-methylase UbiE
MSEPIWNQRIFYELLCDYAKGRRWLDLGCGRGPSSPELIRVRRRTRESLYIGVDLDMISLKNCNEKNRVRARVESLPFPNACFDLVTSNMVFEHLDDPLAVLQEAYRVLDGEGVLIIHTASSLHYMLLAGRLLKRILPQKAYVGLVSRYTRRAEEDIFQTRYRLNTAKNFSRIASKAGFMGGFVTHLETPLDSPLRIRNIEQRIRRFLPRIFKSTILALYVKRQWT